MQYTIYNDNADCYYNDILSHVMLQFILFNLILFTMIQCPQCNISIELVIGAFQTLYLSGEPILKINKQNQAIYSIQQPIKLHLRSPQPLTHITPLPLRLFNKYRTCIYAHHSALNLTPCSYFSLFFQHQSICLKNYLFLILLGLLANPDTAQD